MIRWFKKKCTGKHSKRLRTSSISDLTRSHDYTRHPDKNIYDEIDDSQAGLAYAVTSLADIIDTSTSSFCPICRHQRTDMNTTCSCIDDGPMPPFTIRKDLTEDDDFSWLEYDFKDSQSSLQRSRSENAKRSGSGPRIGNIHKGVVFADDSSSSGYYETDDDDVVISPIYSPVPQIPRRLPNSPSLTPKMGCKVIKRTQSALNTRNIKTLQTPHSDYLSPLKIAHQPKTGLEATSVPNSHTKERQPHRPNVNRETTSCNITKERQPRNHIEEDENEEDVFDHMYINVCIDINNLEIPKLRKSSYRSRSHGQNRLLGDLMKMNYDRQTFNGIHK
ncbi:hypothetical protein SNE40_016536 [Patella caerulea]|uniref:Uncharacterized protein n=1 Tax=Patella caerulea TaxID=87958 RepID=A0AAN8PDP3_PATCE